nr:hypothetical protein StreXyl84_29850 [Streptomyces sp. Xyl84]
MLYSERETLGRAGLSAWEAAIIRGRNGGTDLSEQSGSGPGGLGCFHRGSSLFPARSGALVGAAEFSARVRALAR